MNQMLEILNAMKKKYFGLYKWVERCYAENPDNHGHGLDHALMVAQYAYLIAEDERVAELGWIFGDLHDLGRIHIDPLTLLHNLPPKVITDFERTMVAEAIVNHSKFNDPDDNIVTVIGKDADRLANLGPANLFRAGQHMADLPAFIIGYYGGPHPQQTFKNRVSCRDTLFSNLAWEDDPRVMLRTLKAKKIGKKYFDFYRQFLALHTIQCEETGLVEPL